MCKKNEQTSNQLFIFFYFTGYTNPGFFFLLFERSDNSVLSYGFKAYVEMPAFTVVIE